MGIAFFVLWTFQLHTASLEGKGPILSQVVDKYRMFRLSGEDVDFKQHGTKGDAVAAEDA